MNAVGLRDQYVRVYEPRERNDQGNVMVAYHYTGSWWARADQDTDQKVAAGRGTQPHLTRWALSFADEAVLARGCLVKLEDGTTLINVMGLVPNRLLRRIEVTGEIVSDEQARTFTLFEGDDPVGQMVVEPAS